MKLVNLFETCQESELDIATLLNEQLNNWIEEASEEVSAFRLPEKHRGYFAMSWRKSETR